MSYDEAGKATPTSPNSIVSVYLAEHIAEYRELAALRKQVLIQWKTP
jgi:hypothetical protein